MVRPIARMSTWASMSPNALIIEWPVGLHSINSLNNMHRLRFFGRQNLRVNGEGFFIDAWSRNCFESIFQKVRCNPGPSPRLLNDRRTIENRGCLCLCLHHGQTFKSVPWPCMFGATRSFQRAIFSRLHGNRLVDNLVFESLKRPNQKCLNGII